MTRRSIPPAPRGADALPLPRTYRSSMPAADALAVLDAVRTAWRVPSVRAAAARDVAVLRLVAELGLAGHWLAQLRWEDALVAGCPAIRLRGAGGVECHLIASDELLGSLAEWRSRLALRVGRPVRADEPVFPALGHGMREWGPDRPLVPTAPSYFPEIVRRRLLEVGVDPSVATAQVLRGSLTPERVAAVAGRRAAA